MKLVVVEWVDAMGGNSWQRLPDAADEPESPVVVSVGWEVRRTKKCIWILSSVCPENSMYGQDMTIPAGMIKKVTYVGTKYTIR